MIEPFLIKNTTVIKKMYSFCLRGQIAAGENVVYSANVAYNTNRLSTNLEQDSDDPVYYIIPDN